MVAASRRRRNRDDPRDNGNRTVVMHYPALVRLADSSSNSDVNIEMASMRTTCSTPTIKRSLTKLRRESTKDSRPDHQDEQHKHALQEILLQRQKTCLPLERSSSFLETNAQLPIIDISAFDYDSYRHKLIEASLKRQYGDRQAPGNVVLNSIHLNSISSQSAIQLSEKYSHSLFEFIEEYYDATKPLSKPETEYLHPLDHFLVKGIARPRTADRGTETKESMNELDQVPELVDFRDQSPIPAAPGSSPGAAFGRRRVLEESKHASKLTIRSKRSTSIPRTSSQTSRTAKPSSPASPTTRQLFNREETMKPDGNRPSSADVATEERRKNSPPPRVSRSRTPRGGESTTISQPVRELPGASHRRASSLVQGRSSNESFTPGTTKPSECSEAVSTDRDEKESVTCATASSSEAGSSHSCSSRPRDKRLVRSRASSLSSRSRTIRTPSQTRQWYVGGNANASFNRNYPEARRESLVKPAKPKVSLRPRSTGGRFAWDVPDVPRGTWCDETDRSADQEKPLVLPERPRTANPPLNRRRTPEKGKISDTVLPVLESVADLRVELPCDGLDDFDVQQDVQRSPSPKLREFKRLARSRDKKISSESFVKSSSVAQAPEIQRTRKPPSVKKSIEVVKSPEVPVVVEKSSSGTRPSANRLGSVSRLPVHVGIDRAKMTRLMQSTSRTARAPERCKLPVEENHPERNSSLLGRVKRPSTAGCVKSQASSLSPKIERSLETLRSADTAHARSTEVSRMRGQSADVQKLASDSDHRKTPSRSLSPGMELSPETLRSTDTAQARSSEVSRMRKQSETKKPSRSSNLRTKRTTPQSRTSVDKNSKPPTPRISEDDTNSSRKHLHRDGTVRRPFLRARSGKHGAPKLTRMENTPKDSPTAEKSLADNEDEEKELARLPTEGSKAALVMRRELKTYIKKIKLVLSNGDKTIQAKDLASLSITQAIIPELKALLSPREIQELQGLLDRAEKNEEKTPSDPLADTTRLQ